MKAVGWIDLNTSTDFHVISDDGIGISLSTTGSGFNGSNWLGGYFNPNNQINAWFNQAATNYTFNSPSGSYRIEIDYYQFNGLSVFWFYTPNAINYYHPALPPNNVMPSVEIRQFTTI